MTIFSILYHFSIKVRVKTNKSQFELKSQQNQETVNVEAASQSTEIVGGLDADCTEEQVSLKTK